VIKMNLFEGDQRHWNYLKGDSQYVVIGFFDFVFATNLDARHSISSYTFIIGTSSKLENYFLSNIDFVDHGGEVHGIDVDREAKGRRMIKGSDVI